MTGSKKAMKAEILDKFKHIGYLNSQDVIEQLQELDGIEDQLSYLKNIKADYYDQYTNIKRTLSIKEHKFINENDDFVFREIFGGNDLVTTLKIQKPIYNKYFAGSLNDPLFTYWFMKYNAGILFKKHVENKTFQHRIICDIKVEYLESWLTEIDKDEKKALKLISDSNIDIYSDYRGSSGLLWTLEQNNYLVEIIRILEGNYYTDNVSGAIDNFESYPVQAYFKHKLLKPYLEEKLSKYSESNRSKQEITSINKKIEAQKLLQSIWLPDASISVESFLKKGVDKGIWDEEYHIITKERSLYSTGKKLLGSCAAALRKNAISDKTNHNVVGRIFCQAFNISINQKINQPFKAFTSFDYKLKLLFKKEFDLHL